MNDLKEVWRHIYVRRRKVWFPLLIVLFWISSGLLNYIWFLRASYAIETALNISLILVILLIVLAGMFMSIPDGSRFYPVTTRYMKKVQQRFYVQLATLFWWIVALCAGFILLYLFLQDIKFLALGLSFLLLCSGVVGIGIFFLPIRRGEVPGKLSALMALALSLVPIYLVFSADSIRLPIQIPMHTLAEVENQLTDGEQVDEWIINAINEKLESEKR